MRANYRQIPSLLRQREEFEGNSMKGVRELVSPETLIARSERYFGDEAQKFMMPREMFEYVVYSYSTPIAAVTTSGNVVTLEGKVSHTTSRHQGMLYNLER